MTKTHRLIKDGKGSSVLFTRDDARKLAKHFNTSPLYKGSELAIETADGTPDNIGLCPSHQGCHILGNLRKQKLFGRFYSDLRLVGLK